MKISRESLIFFLYGKDEIEPREGKTTILMVKFTYIYIWGGFLEFYIDFEQKEFISLHKCVIIKGQNVSHIVVSYGTRYFIFT